MKITDMRGHVMALYPSTTWAVRVSRMSDDQVIAIYKDKIERGSEAQKVETKDEDEFPF